MGNCQAIDAAALVIQHPDGKLERMYWPVTASEIMTLNPGHYVSLIIPLPTPPPTPPSDHKVVAAAVQFTRVKLLRPTDTLALGHAYRLVTTQEVVRVLRAKKSAKMKKQKEEAESVDNPEIIVSDKQSSDSKVSRESDSDKDFQFQASKQGGHRRRTAAAFVNPGVLRSKLWRPTLHSILETTS